MGDVTTDRTDAGAVTYQLTDDPERLRSAIDAAFDSEPTYSPEERHCRYRSPHVPHDADWNDGGRMVWHPCPGTPGEIKRCADRIERRFRRD